MNNSCQLRPEKPKPDEANDRSTVSAVSAHRLNAVEKIIRPDCTACARFRQHTIFHNSSNGLDRRRPAEHRKMPDRFRLAINVLHRLAIHQHQPHRLHMQLHRKRRVHRNAQRAVVFPTRQLRSIRRCPRLYRVFRQPLAVDMNRLHRACPNHHQQARKRQRSQPQWIRMLERAAFNSFGQYSGQLKGRLRRSLLV